MSTPEWVRAVRGAGRMAAWRAHAYGGGLSLDAARRPPVRAPDHLLVRVRAASLNPLDLAMLDGYGSRILNVLRAAEGAEGAEGVEFPLVLGRDFVGEVVRAGPATRLRAGARVWGVVPPHRPGALADYVLVHDRWVGAAPAALDDMQAGGALYAALSACAVLRAAGLRGAGVGAGAGAGAARGARVLLLGLGGVGHAALQLLVADGAQVVVGCAGEQCPRALALGAVVALDRHHDHYDRALVDAGPYEAIVDCAGLGGGEAGARPWRFGRYATLTTPLLRDTDRRGLVAGAASAAATLLAQGARLAASPAPTACPRVRWAYFAPRADDIEAVRRLAERGQFVVQVEQVYPWWAAPRALQRAARGAARGKILLDWGLVPDHTVHTEHTGQDGGTISKREMAACDM